MYNQNPLRERVSNATYFIALIVCLFQFSSLAETSDVDKAYSRRTHVSENFIYSTFYESCWRKDMNKILLLKDYQKYHIDSHHFIF